MGLIPPTKVLFSAPVTSPSALNAARALTEIGPIGAFHTLFAIPEHGKLIQAADAFDRLCGTRVGAELRRRSISDFPAKLIHIFPWWEVPRTLVSRANLSDRLAERLMGYSLARFDRHVARRVSSYSVVYAHNRVALETFMAAKKNGAICIYSVSDLEWNFYSAVREREYAKWPNLYGPEQKRLDAIEDRQAAPTTLEWDLADLVIMYSQLCCDTYRAHGFDVAKVRVVPLGFPEISPENRPRVPSDRSRLRIMWAGTFSLMKGAHYFLEAMKLLPSSVDVEVKIFGKLKLPRHTIAQSSRPISVRPTIPRGDLFEEYRRADVLVMPTLSDTFGMVISEAMSQGLPVITTNRAGAAELIRSGENGLIVPACDAPALAEALRRCAENPGLVSAMGAEARNTAASWQWHHFRQALARSVKDALHDRLDSNATASLGLHSRG